MNFGGMYAYIAGRDKAQRSGGEWGVHKQPKTRRGTSQEWVPA